MLDKNGSIMQALAKLVDIFGFDYIKEHKNAPCCYNEEQNGLVTVSFLFESGKERPDLPTDYLGWAVYATVSINTTTTETILVDGVMPDGTRII